MNLTQSNLKNIQQSGVAVPTYDRDAVTAGILHIGVGNFHRAHQAVYLHDLLEAGHSSEWGICGAGVRLPDEQMRARLEAQNWLNTVVEIEKDQMSASVAGAMVDFLHVVDGHKPIIETIAQSQTRIVSLTVTEGGYYVDASTGQFDADHPDILYDTKNLGAPKTVFGAIVAGLALRRDELGTPVTVMSCDNLPGNGDIVRAAVLGVARGADTELEKWIVDNVTFPNGMVDRITPATTDRERQILLERFGIIDSSPVFCEPFRQWVLEDNFANGRPEFEAVGVTLTSNVHEFEAMKIGLLNGGHAIMAYGAGLLGIEFAHDAMGSSLIKGFLRKTLQDDVAPFVHDVPGFTPLEYLDLIFKRFENPGVADTISRLCFDGSNRQPKFTVPSIQNNLSAGKTPAGLALSSALWCRYCNGTDEQGNKISANDPDWENLHETAKRAQTDPDIWLAQDHIYGASGADPQFRKAFSSALISLRDNGVEATIRAYLN